ncbi:cytochrome C oxidase subunit IV family protein [Streptomyces sp. TG1A-8]|uniref:cytochrome C oxidase subunit IV family protein n=1 Tax=Streptomyces sp. TG1A-8 TaxID=3051385 RepID=UPI00265B82CC|nr:cytochrome C oxidase subunit IV family protein [Streptomyces sp. TG1A-8]MDO0929012.1 cytochrome C oxidase subunit IV family protein [Streptomyces sp. TG1A-8]
MKALLRVPEFLAWLVLILATGTSWWLGHDGGADGHRPLMTLIMVVAFTKAWMVGNYFMQLREAPGPLRWTFSAGCFAVCVAVVGTGLIP